MRWKKISDAVVRRLPLYLRVLEEAYHSGDVKLMSSQELGERAGVSPALVRKDLAWFGEFGKQGVGYEVRYLREELRKILNLDREIRVAVIGVGSLGHALVRYNQQRYREDQHFNLHVVALFDADPAKIHTRLDGLMIHPIDTLAEVTRREGLQMAIVTVPASAAQQVVDRCVEAGIRAILNFAPAKLTVPEGVHLANADVSLELQRLAYYLGE
ncbi:redox-sensing transcriptional repressor Rex [Geochorda subterranea]|uniref:Redox-sensing transcriptional repressor Rex n=1 Tax=Geochorda subterranea TaxID=3109564 RepID=A0ABZ1BUV9_9FIRM|nr:redox-sensing transcriptional repressor Rex [Limnochorda sp. LNt]WRP15907.1 redox-sensing transcriptional repressor Rex [Limnochorda sp. LNt]